MKSPLASGSPAAKASGELYVTNLNIRDVEIFANKSWKELGTLSLSCPDGDWFDSVGNFYVANCDKSAPAVYEYAKGASSPSMTYSADLVSPVDVTTDFAGNVYVSDSQGSRVNEYAQGSNSVMYSCSLPGGGVVSAAVDKQGNVFVANSNTIVEYKGGLSGCSGTTLTPTTSFDGGIVIDAYGDIVICDQTGGAVDIIAPPYTSISKSISVVYPSHVHINKKNDQMYVTSYPESEVYIDSYPSGKNIKTLNSLQGVAYPAAAVDTQNFVP